MTAIDMLDVALIPPPGGEVLHKSDRATIIWGDCRDPQVIASVPREYGLLCTDPPYGVRFNSGRSSTFTEIPGDDGSVDWPAVLSAYVFGYRPEHLAAPLRLGGMAELVWDKGMLGMGDLTLPWGPAHEPITFGVHVKRKSNRVSGYGNLSARMRRGSIIRSQRPNSGSVKRHSNEKST